MNYKFIKYNILYLHRIVDFIFLINFKSYNYVTQMKSVFVVYQPNLSKNQILC